MKKKTFLILCAAIVSSIAYYYTSENEMQDVMTMRNIEALSEIENDESLWEYPDGKPNTFTCGATTASHWWGNSTCAYNVIICTGGGAGCNERRCPEHG